MFSMRCGVHHADELLSADALVFCPHLSQMPIKIAIYTQSYISATYACVHAT